MPEDPQRNSPDPSRPKPEYGEYAPEGWSWKPETEAAPTAGAAPSGAREGSGQLTGVPHNLGVDGGTVPAQQQPAQPTHAPQPPAAPDATTPPQPGAPYRAGEPTYRPAQQPASRLGDRIVTIVLLVLGAIGALNFAASLYGLTGTFSTIAAALDLEGFTVPSNVQTIGTVGALIVLALYALTLIYSIQRMRGRKITFWVPLTAGVIAAIVAFAFTAIAMAQSPELLEAASDPDATAKLLDYMAGLGTAP
ncbi:MAG: DUF6264 family protein [Leucobacter sp.]